MSADPSNTGDALGEPPRPCPECGGARVRERVRVPLLLPEHPSLRERFSAGGSVHAVVCTRCGLINLYADAPPSPGG